MLSEWCDQQNLWSSNKGKKEQWKKFLFMVLAMIIYREFVRKECYWIYFLFIKWITIFSLPIGSYSEVYMATHNICPSDEYENMKLGIMRE